MSLSYAEAQTQQKVIQFFENQLGYTYLGNFKDNTYEKPHILTDILSKWLSKNYPPSLVNKTIEKLIKDAFVSSSQGLYTANQVVYQDLRYGIKVLPDVGDQHQTIFLIDWKNPENNHFAFAEEVTVPGKNTKRPDIVLYINGIAVAILELKSATTSVLEGIRQHLTNQETDFIPHFYTTAQLLLAANETEGVRYAVIQSPEKFWLQWKEPESSFTYSQNRMLNELGHLCNKTRLLELIHDFIIFDKGVKKICRHNQYFGIKAAQDFVKRKEGGIIWHTQGSGKSLTMVWLARWIKENVSNSRVIIITDRIELDEQIEKVFSGVGEKIYRTTSGRDLINCLQDPSKSLVCSLIHKFGRADELREKDVDDYIEDIKKFLPKNFKPYGDIYVFVDECHRTQSGKLHRAMKSIIPDATFIGFTGTPLLKSDKATTHEIFGRYIHTYKYDDAVKDGVVLDLVYEARDIDQKLTSPEKIDQWFETKTKHLSDYAKTKIKQKWGTINKLLSAQDRLRKIVGDILMDMNNQPILEQGWGNAMLVTDSIYNACRVYEMFQETELKGKCAIITSFRPDISQIKNEHTGEGDTDKILEYNVYRKMLAQYFNEPEDVAVKKIDEFEKQVKKKFIDEPGQMKLLIVVDKLLTGFDAPPATFLYIDKPMRDHTLFQAICRVNRVYKENENKKYGYIIDYRDLFKYLEKSILDYTSEAFDNYDKKDIENILKLRIEKAKEALENAREKLRLICEGVPLPKSDEDYLHYFGSKDSANKEEIKENEPKRILFYKSVSSLLWAYSNIALELEDAGYTREQIKEIQEEIKKYERLRQLIQLYSGDYVDMKEFEPTMRHLYDTYIQASDSQEIAKFDEALINLLIKQGEKTIQKIEQTFKNPESVAETIENNIRRVIIDEMPTNPVYFERMSQILDNLIEERRNKAIEYQEYLKKIQELAQKIKNTFSENTYPSSINAPVLKSIYDNLSIKEYSLAAETSNSYSGITSENLKSELVQKIYHSFKNAEEDGWKSNNFKRKKIKLEILKTLNENKELFSENTDLDKTSEQLLQIISQYESD